MSALFVITELLEFAIKIEQAGYRFYVEAIKQNPDREVVNLFQYLADEEFKHEMVFKALLETLTASGVKPAAEKSAFLKKMFSSHPLADPQLLSRVFSGQEAVEEIVEMALAFEKDSVIFYTELRELVDQEGSAKVDRIIREEMGHIRKLVEFKSALHSV